MNKYIYMAGLLDGEGTVGITYLRGGATWRSPYISVTSTTPEIIAWLYDNFGGSVQNQKVYQDHHKPSQTWKLRNVPQIIELLINVMPYMLEPEKIRRGTMLVNHWHEVTPRNGKYSQEGFILKRDFENEFLHGSC